MLKRKLLIVGTVAFLFRLLFIVWGLTDCYLLPVGFMTTEYFSQGYAICSGYGYISECWSEKPVNHLAKFKELADQGVHLTPQTAPKFDKKEFYPAMVHPPGMALLVAGIHWITGSRVDIYFQIIGMLLDTASACLFCWMVFKFFSERVAFTAGLVYALYPPLAFSSSLEKLSEGLMPIFILSSLVFVLQSTRSSGKKVALWWVLAGMALGISGYVRPDYVMVPVAYGFALWIYTRRFWRSILALITIQAATLLFLMPWAYRNYETCGRWIFTSGGVGWALINGLGEYHNPWGIVGIDEHIIDEAHKQGFNAPDTPEADVYFRNIFWKSIRSEPLGYLSIVVKRLPLVILSPYTCGFNNPYKTSRFKDTMEQGQDRFQVILSKPMYIIKAYWEYLLIGVISIASLLCTLAMLVFERRRFGLVFLLLTPHLYSITTHLLTHYEPRFLLPSVFSFLLGLAYVLSRGWRDRDTAIVPC
jgi:4-amino-4-deoxy-L-arabinose transferase-like glycosyltransferase